MKKVDPNHFFHNKHFVPDKMIKFLKKKLDLIHDGSEFYVYNRKRGFWETKHDDFIGQIIVKTLDYRKRTSFFNESIKLLELDVFKEAKEIKSDPRFINCKNGMLDIETKKLLRHHKKYYSRTQVPIDYNPQATCPRWMQFLAEIFPDDPEKALTIQEFSGYCLAPKIFLHVCLFLIGTGGNGKSVFIKTLSRIIGQENISALELHQLSDKFLLGSLKDKLLNISSEVHTKTPVDGSIFKQVVAGDMVQADIKYRQPFTFIPVAKHIFAMNEPPIITDRTFALARRLIIVKFNQMFSGSSADKHLEDRLVDELAGILNWCLSGLVRVLAQDDIAVTDQIQRDKDDFMKAINPVLSFVDEECLVNSEYHVEKSLLYKAYSDYCWRSGFKALSNTKFYYQLKNDFTQIQEIRPDGSKRHFKGINHIGV